MALKPGTQVGPYEITAPLGAGGMGEVFRATDSKLKREVAIKALPDAADVFPRDRGLELEVRPRAHEVVVLEGVQPGLNRLDGLQVEDVVTLARQGVPGIRGSGSRRIELRVGLTSAGEG